MTQHKIFLIGGKDDEVATIDQKECSDGLCLIICNYREKSIEAKAEDFFDALCQIRLKLEKEGLIPFCYGASLNVYPSGMARDMGSGNRAYKLQIGQHASGKNLVGIFDEGPDVIPVFVARQKEYWEEWLASKKI